MNLALKSEKTQRLDVFLGENGGITRSYAEKLIARGLCHINGAVAKKSGEKLKAGDEVFLEIPDAVTSIEKKDIRFGIIYEDDDIAIIDKPQGLTVHPAAGNYTDTLVNGLMYRLKSLSGINGEIRPGIVHRLDKNTSGVMVVAKNDKAHLSLSSQIANRAVKKRYVALLEGNLPQDEGTIKTYIGRNPKNRKKMAVLPSGREAITGYKVLERFSDNCFVLFDLHTGRTHQIRVHAAYTGHPVVGDPEYGFKKQKFHLSGQLLHSYMITLRHPSSGEVMTFRAPLPDYFVEIYNILAKKDNKPPYEQKTVDKIIGM